MESEIIIIIKLFRHVEFYLFVFVARIMQIFVSKVNRLQIILLYLNDKYLTGKLVK